ncbi:MAG: hypothetical protein HOM55_06740 [Proteobacteria bacterium]|nr:hypothetical protein [Pseudomonadota bacterium]
MHIAHNVEIGKDSIIAAQCGIAGSSTIGERVIMSGQTGVLDHTKVADDVVFVHRAGPRKRSANPVCTADYLRAYGRNT